MSYVVATTALLATAADDLAAVRSSISAANAAAAASTTSVLTAAADEVSMSIAALFGAHGLEYQLVNNQATQFHEQFVGNLLANANAYLTTEFGNAMAAGPLPAAGTRITVPGAGPLYAPDFITRLPFLGQVFLQGRVPGPASVSLLQGYDLLNHAIGQNWFPGTAAQVVNYPASIGLFSGSLGAPSISEAIAIGQRMLDAQIVDAVANANGSPVHIAALSAGTLVVHRELTYLATAGNAPPPNALEFTLFASPEIGLVQTYLPTGATVPFIGYTSQGLLNTQYNVNMVFGQYDGWANPPDRPWNLLSVVNALFGTAYYHHPSALASMSEAVELSSVTTPLGGTITTYMIPSPILPMLLPLQQIGVPQPIVNGLNMILQPIVNAGYSSLDPNAGPYFSGGLLVNLPRLL